jgi:hypothetical protein
MRNILFTSRLDCRHQKALEQILFLNGNQQKVSEGALSAVEHYGPPRISPTNGRLWVVFDSGVEAQSLFVTEQDHADNQLIGVVVYTREGDVLSVLFLAIREDYAGGGDKAGEGLFYRILDEVRGIARRVKGITSLRLFLTKPPTTISLSMSPTSSEGVGSSLS